MSAQAAVHPQIPTAWWRVMACCGLAAGLVSCESAGSFSIGGSGLDPLGHRPGPQGFSTVVIDAGHGGKDSGAVSRKTGLVEKTLALDMAQRLRSELRSDFRVVMMRDSDVFVDLDERVRRANSYPNSVLVSLHFNSYGSRSAGPETYFWRVDSYTLAKRVQLNLSVTAPAHSSRGLVRRRLRLTRNPSVPSILVECGYISNAGEAKLLAQSSYRDKLAHGIATAIKTQRVVGDGNLGPLPKPINAPLSTHHDARS